jgi:CelD/BcsL family acetyltransferase involved in cellulose biosynthesis
MDEAVNEGFGRVRSAWHELSDNALYFFQTPEWIERIAPLAGPGTVFAQTHEGGRAASVAIFRRHRHSIAGVSMWMLSEIKLDRMPPLAEGLVRPDQFDRRRLEETLRAAGRWHVLRLLGQRRDSPWLKFTGGGNLIFPEPEGGVGILETDTDFDARWRALPRKIRDSVRRGRERIGDAGRIEVATGPAIGAAFDDFVALEASGWKGEAGTALAHRPSELALMRDYVTNSSAAQMRTLRIRGQVAAMQMAVTTAGRVVLLKVAYDESLAEFAPGNVLLADLIEVCCRAPDIKRIDCINWQPWESRWGMTREPTFQFVAFNRRTIRGTLAGLTWNALRSLRKRLKKAPPVQTKGP